MKLLCLSAVAALAWMVGTCRVAAIRADTPPVPRESGVPRVLTTQFTYTATIPAPGPDTRRLDVWIPLPSDSAWQAVRDVHVDSPVSYKITRESKFGNRMVYLHLAHPRTALVVTVRCVVARKSVQALIPNDAQPLEVTQAAGVAQARAASPDVFGPSARLLAGDEKVPVGGRYGEIANQVVGEKTGAVAKMRAIFEYTVANMQYDYKKESPRYAEGDVAFVCDYKKGNCSDLHSYMISLARSQGIPAVLEFGFPIAGIPLAEPIPQEGSIGGYHCWLWFQTEGQDWIPLDASDARRWLDARRPDVKEKLFGSLVPERSAVAVSRGRDLTLVPAQKGMPLNYFIYPYAEADGKPTEAKWELHYRRMAAATALKTAAKERQ